MRGVFYTPGWGAVLTVTGTLGGVIITQAVNSWSTQGARRKERYERINDAVGDLIACGNAWVFAVAAEEDNIFSTVIMKTSADELLAVTDSGIDDRRAAQLAYGRALARVTLTCPRSIISAASDYLEG